MKIRNILDEITSNKDNEEERKKIMNNILDNSEVKIKNLVGEIVKDIKSHNKKGKKIFSNDEIIEIKVNIINYFEDYLNRKL